MGLAITLQALGQDFNNSRGLCGNFNGLRDDDVDFIDPILEEISSNVTNQKRSKCDHSYSYDQAKINHMISTDKSEKIGKFNKQIPLKQNTRLEFYI